MDKLRVPVSIRLDACQSLINKREKISNLALSYLYNLHAASSLADSFWSIISVLFLVLLTLHIYICRVSREEKITNL